MQFFSTNGRAPRVSFREATIAGQAPDKGLYFPETVPAFDKEMISQPQKFSREELALMAIQPYVGDTIPESHLKKIVEETISFDFPLVPVGEHIFSLELFHGPTMAFKDVGARFMSRCLGYFVQGMDQKVTVLVATSGDTGGAVANGFFDVEGVEVVILYPSGKVSDVQERQLTTLGKNIKALEVEGSFDDCQRLVKDAFADEKIRNQLFLTSANSINVARWLPQQFYYLFAWQTWPQKEVPPVVSVPSGNFGNICAGMLAAASGLPVKHFIAACNANDVVPEFLRSGNYQPKATKHTLSNAMDVGDPSNFVRIMELFQQQFESLKTMLSADSISDAETEQIMKEVFSRHHYLLDPHGAVGYGALKRYLQDHPNQSGYFLETAHPLKFYDVVEKIIPGKTALTSSVKELLTKEKKSEKIKADAAVLKAFLLA
ncbi:MAG: threonine synthase [Flavisolibacter sp.]